ncbi:MAG: hypothetical protein JW800_07855 [Candidatus Omnitrophica bacterium]|nr:hypothetical protein [Candidatus Omnitrophota bacterium]
MTDKIKPVAKKLFFCLYILALMFTAGCGYSRGSLLPADFKNIYVDNFKNGISIDNEVTEANRYSVYRPGLENYITNEIVERFVFDGNLKISRKDDADLILSGELVDYRLEPLRYDRNDNIEEYRIKIVVNASLRDVSKDSVMWQETGYAGVGSYKTMGRLATSEDAARDEALEDLARRIVERTIENW